MMTEKKIKFQSILESSEGIHLTAYLVNRGNIKDLKSQIRETLDEANEWLEPVQTSSERKRFLAPLSSLLKETRLFKGMKGNIGIFRTKDSFRVLNLPVEVERKCHVASSFHVKPEAKETLENALMEFRFAEEENLVKKNIFQIAKAAVQGRVRKLIVADEVNVFGKIDKKTGKVAIHPFDLDHEDDDLLDDLAQTVLASGGEVVIAPRDEIPKRRPVLAILDHPDLDEKRPEERIRVEPLKSHAWN